MFSDFKYQTIQSWSGKVKKISSQEWIDAQGTGEYYPPEGCLAFKTPGSKMAYFYGGAKHSKPDNWGCSNLMIKTEFCDTDDSSGNFKISGFSLYNHSSSQTSSFPKMAFTDPITIDSTDTYLYGFIVNGIDLDLPSREKAFSDEIVIFETATDTTFRTKIIRTPERARKVPVDFKNEPLQTGDIPIPMYASSFTQIDSKSTVKVKLSKAKGTLKSLAMTESKGLAVLIGGTYHLNRNMSDADIFFSGSDPWAEASSGGVWLLEYDLREYSFVWSKKCDIEPRSFHKTAFIGTSLYVFGGIDVNSRRRYGLDPIVINVNTWTVTKITIANNTITGISGHSLLKAKNSSECYILGGYRQNLAVNDEEPVDSIIKVSLVNETEILGIEEHELGSGGVAQSVFIDSPNETCMIIGGGTKECWGIISPEISPGDPCDLAIKGKCLVDLNRDDFSDIVQWVFCANCKRWFHHYCMNIKNSSELRKAFIKISSQLSFFTGIK